MVATGVLDGKSSANTPHSRIRLAINCEYCPPKSRTSTSSTACTSVGVSSDDLPDWDLSAASLTILPTGGTDLGDHPEEAAQPPPQRVVAPNP
ncbi:MAG TPA: hypothetical protein VF093_03730 [Solirubrobacterales bacterium]